MNLPQIQPETEEKGQEIKNVEEISELLKNKCSEIINDFKNFNTFLQSSLKEMNNDSGSNLSSFLKDCYNYKLEIDKLVTNTEKKERQLNLMKSFNENFLCD